MPSSTPLQRSWCMTKGFSIAPGVFVSLGMMQRTKWGWVDRRFVINLFKFSCRGKCTHNLSYSMMLRSIFNYLNKYWHISNGNSCITLAYIIYFLFYFFHCVWEFESDIQLPCEVRTQFGRRSPSSYFHLLYLPYCSLELVKTRYRNYCKAVVFKTLTSAYEILVHK